MVQRLRTLPALVKDTHSVPNTHMEVHSCLHLQFLEALMSSSDLHRHSLHMVHRHACRTPKYTNKLTKPSQITI